MPARKTDESRAEHSGPAFKAPDAIRVESPGSKLQEPGAILAGSYGRKLQGPESEAIRKACLYSFVPNRLGFCGKEKSWAIFQKFLGKPGGENLLAVKNALRSFNALFPYLELIAGSNSLKPLDSEVIEAYWIGNALLENVPEMELQKTVLSFQRFGLPRGLAEEKASSIADGMVPHHSFHVLHVNFISGKVPPLAKNLSECLVSWAKAKGEKKGLIGAKGLELFSESGQLKLREKEKKLENPFGIAPERNSFVSVHWNNAIEPLSQKRLCSLKKYTIKNLDAINNTGSLEEL